MSRKAKGTAPAIPKKYTRARKTEWWGKSYTVKPAAASAHLGDGKLLLAVQCLNTRPDYYLIRVDSKFHEDGNDGYDSIDGVIEALIDEFSEMEREREELENDLREQGIEPDGDNTDLDGNETVLGWPVLSLDSGYHWWTEAEL